MLFFATCEINSSGRSDNVGYSDNSGDVDTDLESIKASKIRSPFVDWLEP